MKKLLFLILGFVTCAVSVFAQYSFSDLNDMPGACVAYVDVNGNHLNMVNVGETYVASYFNQNEIYAAEFIMKKGYLTEYEVVYPIAGTKEECEDKLIHAIHEIVSYGDYSYREKVQNRVFVKRQELNGKLISSAILDFYIPITNVISISDGEGNVVNHCVYVGYLDPSEVNSFLTAEMDYSSAVMRDMKKIKAKKSQNVTLGNIEVKLPKNFEYSSKVDGYIVKDTTSMDSAIIYANVNLAENQLTDINAYVVSTVLTTQGIVLPEGISLSQVGDVKIMRIDYISYQYGEYNTVLQCIIQKDENTLECLTINGYTSFIDLNMDMYNEIIKSIKLKK